MRWREDAGDSGGPRSSRVVARGQAIVPLRLYVPVEDLGARSGTMLAESTKAHAERNPSLDPASDDDWHRLEAMLPVDLDAVASQSEAILRRRKITSGSVLLRLILIYVLCSLSLRDTASWAARALGLMLTDEALGYRFARAAPFVQQIAMTILGARLHEKPVAGVALRLLDATVLSEPGSTGTDWRAHVTYDPVRADIVGVEVTDAHGGEHVRRAATMPGDLVMGDMGLGHASDVREANERGVRALLRAHLQSLAVDDLQGRRMAPEKLMDDADKGHVDRDVLLPEEGREKIPVRLVVVPLPPEQAGRARQKLRKERKGRPISELTLRLAGYFCCITTLTREEAPTEAVLTWYRVRWQIELLFKRSKSLLHLDQLAKAKPALVTLQIWGRLLVAILVEKMASTTRSAKSIDAGAPPVSLWRLAHIHWIDIVLAVYGGATLVDRLARAEAAAERLRERPRRKRTWAQKLIETIRSALHPPSTSSASA